MNTDVLAASQQWQEAANYDAHHATVQLAPGTSIQNKYVVHGVLGLGGFAVVYDAEHVGLGRRVAIKVLHLAPDTPLALLERFRREARISALVSHRNVLEVYDTGALDDGSPYLVMERVNGQNLSRVLREGPLSLAAAMEVTRQLLCGLVALAEGDVVHRDIKPDNLMLHDPGDGNPVVKLVDFGISKRVAVEPQAKLTCHGMLVGTPQYMSPEQIRGQEVDARTDIYATGAVLYEALGGHAPHESENFSELVVSVLNAPLRPLRELRANCPTELERIATKALSRSAAHRYGSAREMLRELEACARELELPVGPRAFACDDPIDPIWMTPVRVSFPTLRSWWMRGVEGVRRPLQLAAAVALLVAPSAALYREGSSVDSVASAAVMSSPFAALPVERNAPRAELPQRVPSLLREAPAAFSPRTTFNAPRPSPLASAFLGEEAVASAVMDAVPQQRHEARRFARLERAAEREEKLAPQPAPEPVVVVAPKPVAPPPEEEVDPERHTRWERAMDGALGSMVRGELALAKTQYEVATKLEPKEPAAFRGLGLACARLGQTHEARSALRRYLALSPHASDAKMVEARLASLSQ